MKNKFGSFLLAGALLIGSILPGIPAKANPVYTIKESQVSFGGATTVIHAQYTLTSANITGMNGTPVTILPAVSGKTIVPLGVFMTFTKAGSAAYGGGGAVSVQYHGGATCTGTVAATTITAASGSTYSNLAPVSAIGAQNTGLDITNASGAFTSSGATGTAVLDIYYRLQ